MNCKEMKSTRKSGNCKRPYELGRRQEATDQSRAAILKAARSLLESQGFLRLTMDALARSSGVTRQTVHNLFGTKAELLEALFDHLANDGGLGRMPLVMQQSDPEAMLTGLVEIFTGYWSKHRMILKRIHGIAAIDPEFGKAVAARNNRRRGLAARVVERLRGRVDAQRAAALYALTGFEFFDVMAEYCGNEGAAAKAVMEMVKRDQGLGTTDTGSAGWGGESIHVKVE